MNRTAVFAALLGILSWVGSVWAGTENGLVAYYDFDEGQGETAHDRSGNGNDAKLIGAKWLKLREGYCVQFEAANYVDCGTRPSLNVRGPLTISAWFITGELMKDDCVLLGDRAGYTVNRNFNLIKTGATVRFEHGSGPDGGLGFYKIGDPPGDETWLHAWQHIVFVADYPRWKMHLNGKLQDSGNMSIDITPTPGGHKQIGGWNFTGKIDEVRIYNRALPEAQVLELYEKEWAKKCKEQVDPELRKVVVKPHLYYPKSRVDVALNLQLLGELTAGSYLDVGIFPAGQMTPVQQERLSLVPKAAGYEVRFNLEGLAPGRYEIRAIAFDPRGSQVGKVAVRQLSWPERPKWMDAKVGIVGDVLPPWTPLEVEERRGEGVCPFGPGAAHIFLRQKPFLPISRQTELQS